MTGNVDKVVRNEEEDEEGAYYDYDEKTKTNILSNHRVIKKTQRTMNFPPLRIAAVVT